MKRHTLFAVLALSVLLAATAFAGGKWIKFDGTLSAQAPQTAIEANSAGAFAFRVHLPTFQVQDVEANGETWQQVVFQGQAFHSTPGEPALPVFSRWIAVPQGAVPRVTVTAGASRVVDGVRHLPAQTPPPDCYCAEAAPFTVDESIYDSAAMFPGTLYRLGEPVVVRGLTLVKLDLYPVQVSPATDRAVVTSDLRARIDFEGGKGRFFTDRRGRAFQSMYDMAFNRMAFAREPRPLTAGKSANGAEYIVLTAPAFLDAAQDLAEWKILQGYDVEVYTTDDSGDSCAEIKAWLQDAYDNWDPAPEFVLFVGDAEFIPPCYEVYGYDGLIGSDVHYTQLDGGDMWSDLALGRMSVDTAAQAQLRVDNTLNYERDPIDNDTYYTNAYHAAYFQTWDGTNEERRFIRTSEEICQWFNTVLDDSPFTSHRIFVTESSNNPQYWNQDPYYNWPPAWWGETGYNSYNIPPELLRSNGFAWDGDAADIAAAVNGGAAFLTHRDHGGETGWSDPAFEVGDVNALTNGDMLPVLWSINCLTGFFDNETGGGYHTLAFTEAWERSTTGGAVGIIGSTRVSYSGPNDRLTWAWMDAMWPDYVPDFPAGENNEPEWRMGLVVPYGKFYLNLFYSGDSMLEEAVTEFHWFGDPTLEMWAGVPQTMNVSYVPVIPMGALSFDVNVDVDGALAALSQDGVPLGKAYSSGGQAHIEFDAPITSVSAAHLVVTRHQYRPYEADIIVGATADGIIVLDRAVYTEAHTIHVTLSDADLSGDDAYVLHIDSDSEPAGEDINCAELEDYGTFFGEIEVATGSAVNGNGVLTINDGDTITLYYHDADNGSGSPEDKTDTAYADTAPPTFAGLVSAEGGDHHVDLAWDAATDLTPPITYQIYRAETSGGQNFDVPLAETNNLTYIDGNLPNMVTFYYVVRATDSFGHQETNTNELTGLTVGPVTIWEEDFDDKAGIPATWTIVNGGHTGYTWSDENPCDRSTASWSGTFAIADSDCSGSGKEWNDSMITESIDCSGYSDIRLLFMHDFNYISGYGDDRAIVDVSNDDGANWTNVVNWTGADRSGLEDLDVSTWADGQTNVKFRFTYTGNYDYWWGIDDLELIGLAEESPAQIEDFLADVTDGEAPLTVNFTAETSGAVASFTWDFGDGNISHVVSPAHTYNDVGEYTVTLTVEGPYGDDTMVKAAYITVTCPAPTVEFSADVTTGDAPLTVQFTDESTAYATCEPTAIEWDFGDGDTSGAANPEHVYDAAGNFTVKLTYTTDYGTGEYVRTRFNYIHVNEPADDDDDDDDDNDDTSPDDDDDTSPDDDDDTSPDDDDDDNDNDDNDDDDTTGDDDDDDNDDSGCGC